MSEKDDRPTGDRGGEGEGPGKRTYLDPLEATREGSGRPTLDALRKAVREVDERLLDLVSERIRLARTIGEEKLKRNLPIQDFSIEKRVVDAARTRCRELGIDERIGEDVLRPLILNAVRVQEKERVRAAGGAGTGRRVLVVGGAGLMGRWFADFLSSQGHRVTIADPKGPVEGFAYTEEFTDAAATSDVVIVATPPSVTSAILDDLASSGTDGVVFDVCSLKSPIKGSLMALAERGVDVCSIHPMFGPGTDLLSGKHVIVCPLGSPRAVQTVRGFFHDTCAAVVEMSVEDHDRLVSYVLGLSHAVNICFNDVLARTGRPLAEIRPIGSTTFENQVRVAEQLAWENPHLYYEIQALNEYSPQMLDALEDSLHRFMRDVRSRHRERFVEMMGRARTYYEAYEATVGEGPPAEDDPQAEPTEDGR